MTPDGQGRGGGRGHGHGHGHGTPAGAHRGRLAVVLGLTVAVLVVEVVGAWISGSLALLADAGHMLADAGGVALALVAVTLAQVPATPRRTFGLARAEILATALNAAVLLGVGVYVLVEAVRRMTEPPEVATGAMLVFGLVGLTANVVSLSLLAGGQHASLPLRAAFLEVAVDAVGSVGVIVAAAFARWGGADRADPIVAAAIGVFILPRAWRLLGEAVDILLQATPRGLDLADVRRHILEVPHVQDVHDLHAWTVTSGMPVLSAHVVVDAECFHDGHAPQLLDELQGCLTGHFAMAHATFQLEPAGHAEHEPPTHA